MAIFWSFSFLHVSFGMLDTDVFSLSTYLSLPSDSLPLADMLSVLLDCASP
jgi:hypothetical protein